MHFVKTSSWLSALAVTGLTIFTSSLSTNGKPLVSTPSSAAAGQQACASLEKSLGNGKVVTALTNTPSFLNSTLYYYSAEQSFNTPACVVVPTEYTDVQTTMKAIRQFNSTMALKAGGHNTNNYWSSTAGGVLIDFKGMRQKSYDSSTQLGYFQPGNIFGDLYAYYQNYNRVVVGARISTIGSGLLLGGGLSFLSAQYGLGCDSFESMDVVLPDGSLVTATKTNQYSDLMLALKGGGNQFGIVVGYTVKTYPLNPAWGGLLIYDGSKLEQVFQQALNFTNNNPDPKAAIIATSIIALSTEAIELGPISAALNLTSFVVLFNVYDGPDGAAAFQAFTDIPHILDTRKQQSYLDLENMVEVGAALSSGSTTFYASSQNSQISSAPQTLSKLCSNFINFANENQGTYTVLSMDFEPVPQSLIQAGRENGGNALDSGDGPYYWVNYLYSSLPKNPISSAALQKFAAMVAETPNDPTLPIFLNDADKSQPILQSYGAYDKLKQAKAKYDPDNFLATNMGGPSFTVSATNNNI